MKRIELDLPDEFVEYCEKHQVEPETVLRDFIANAFGLMNYVSKPRPDGYSSLGSDERMLAQQYLKRCHYPRGGFDAR